MQYQDKDQDSRSPSEKIVDELVKEARKANQVDRERGDAMTALAARPEWRTYVELLSFRIQNFADQMLAPLATMDQVLAQEYLKGAMSGLIIARDLPTIIIAAMKDIRPAAETDEE